MRNKLIILFFLLATSLSAQRIVQNGSGISSGAGGRITSGTGGASPLTTIVSASVQDATPGRFSVFFSDNIDGVSPNVSEWTITVNGTPHTATSYQIWYDQVNFYSGSVEAVSGDVVTITYSGSSWISYPDYYLVQNYTNYPVTNNIVPPEPPSGEWTILHQWDFEGADLGVFGSTEVDAYFPYVFIKVSMGNGDSIVIDTIDGIPTQVLRINEEVGGGQSGGFTACTYFDVSHTEYDSVCVSYRHKFDKDYELVSGNTKIGAKLRGYDGVNYATGSVDFEAAQLLKPGMRLQDYLYGYYKPSFFPYNPWSWISYSEPAIGEPAYKHGDSVFYVPGVWYDETVCASMNTPGNSDSRYEQWTNGDMIVSMPTDGSGRDEFGWLQHPDQLKINYVRISAFQSDPEDGGSKDSYYYIDDVTIWTPTGDTYWDNGQLHPSGTSLVSPVAITDHSVYYDTLYDVSSTADTLWSTGYPSDVGAGWTGAYLIDAGAGEQVKATVIAGSIGSTDWMQVYDGNDAEDELLYRFTTSSGDLTDDFDAGGATITSSGRYLYICAGSSESTSGVTAFRFRVEKAP